MYAYIRGNVEEKHADRAVLDAGGVGYEMICSDATLRQIAPGREAKLFAHFSITQDGAALYGFYTAAERSMFRKLTAVTRVGPKLALSILGRLSVQDIALAIVTQNTAALEGIPGLGKKTAARLMLELKEKVADDGFAGPAAAAAMGGGADMRAEAVAALVALGYDGVSAGRAVAAVKECGRVEEMITLALKEIAKGRSL